MTDGEEKSLEDILSDSLPAAYDAAEAGQDDGGTVETPTAAAPADGRVRDEHGRFTSQAADTAPAAAAPDKIPDLGSKPADGAAPAAKAAAPSDAPASWSDAEKAHWKTLPPGVQAAIARREAEFAAGIEQKTQGYKALDDVIAPRSEMLRRTYGSVENGIKELLGLSDYAVSQPAEFAKWFVHQHRLDPQELFAGVTAAAGAAPQQGQTAGQAPAADPNAAVQAQIEAIREEVHRMTAAPIIAKAKTDLQKFEAEAATKHPHYANQAVKQGMRALLSSEGCPDDMTYEQAYERVVWSLPELRQQLIEAETKAALEKQSAAAAEAARKARTTAGPQLRSVGAPQGVQAGKRSIDDTLGDVYDRVTGAA